MPPDTTPLAEIEDAYLADHRSRNSSPKTIEHYRDTFKDLRRFLDATGRDATVEALTTATLQAFHTWLVETPIARPWRGSTVRSARSIQSRMKDLRAVLAWATEHEYLNKTPKVTIPKVPQRLFPVFTDQELVTLFSCLSIVAHNCTTIGGNSAH